MTFATSGSANLCCDGVRTTKLISSSNWSIAILVRDPITPMKATPNELRRVIGELQRSGRLKTMTIEVDGATQAVSLSLQHSNKMVALYAASNNDFSNLGKLLNVETIQEACRLRVDEVSFMTGMKWKADWRMKSDPCHTMRKPPGPWPEIALT